MTRKIPKDSKVSVKFTAAERRLLESEPVMDTDFFNFAVVHSKYIEVKLTLDDLEYVADYIAAVANHCDSPATQRRLDKLFYRLGNLLDSLEELDE